MRFFAAIAYLLTASVAIPTIVHGSVRGNALDESSDHLRERNLKADDVQLVRDFPTPKVREKQQLADDVTFHQLTNH